MVIFSKLEHIEPLHASTPPQMSEQEFDKAKLDGEKVVEGMHKSFIVFILINVLLGGLLSKLIGVLSTL